MSTIKKVLITEEEIQAKVKEIAAQINRDYEGKELLFVPVLKGAAVFGCDLFRELTIPAKIDFLATSSYGNGTSSSGVVTVTKDIDLKLNGKHILIVEDILDSGNTLFYLKNMLESRGAESVRLCTFMQKPARLQKPITSDYNGFVIPDEYVVGYGLDYDQLYRNLKFVGVLDESGYA